MVDVIVGGLLCKPEDEVDAGVGEDQLGHFADALQPPRRVGELQLELGAAVLEARVPQLPWW